MNLADPTTRWLPRRYGLLKIGKTIESSIENPWKIMEFIYIFNLFNHSCNRRYEYLGDVMDQ